MLINILLKIILNEVKGIYGFNVHIENYFKTNGYA